MINNVELGKSESLKATVRNCHKIQTTTLSSLNEQSKISPHSNCLLNNRSLIVTLFRGFSKFVVLFLALPIEKCNFDFLLAFSASKQEFSVAAIPSTPTLSLSTTEQVTSYMVNFLLNNCLCSVLFGMHKPKA